MLSPRQERTKRLFDLGLAFLLLPAALPLIAFTWLIAALETRSNGFFYQERIGRHGVPFTVIKIKTMWPAGEMGTTVTTENDRRITRSGRFIRRWKLDELPQLFNVLRGEMSFVGPRPDVPGFADSLEGDDREILSLRPGITGPATLKYRDEEQLLSRQADPERYNREIIWPDKVAINRQYLAEWSLKKDLRYLWQTIKR